MSITVQVERDAIYAKSIQKTVVAKGSLFTGEGVIEAVR